MLSFLPKRILHELLTKHGRGLCDDPAKLAHLLGEACPRHPREVQVLLEPLQLGMVNELLMAPSNQDWRELAEPLIRRLTAHDQFTDSEARSSIEAWVQCLHIPVANAPFGPLEDADMVEQQYEAQTRGAHQRGAWMGVAGGAITGLMLALIAESIWSIVKHPMVMHHAAEDRSSIILLGIALVVGGAVGYLGGWLLGETQSILARGLVGACLGLSFGIYYHDLWDHVVGRRVHGHGGALLLEALLGALVGLISGCLFGLSVDAILTAMMSRFGVREIDALDALDAVDGRDLSDL